MLIVRTMVNYNCLSFLSEITSLQPRNPISYFTQISSCMFPTIITMNGFEIKVRKKRKIVAEGYHLSICSNKKNTNYGFPKTTLWIPIRSGIVIPGKQSKESLENKSTIDKYLQTFLINLVSYFSAQLISQGYCCGEKEEEASI